ncbi:MAG: DUF4935 domain-containing protein, partial [Deltaproteobacteria bacterium]|nr:DUF4935 domain-containing protein [Deltaproteobacteria bacterium]
MIVILDTTEFFGDPWLGSAGIRLFHEILRKSKARLFLSTVVVREAQRLYARAVQKSHKEVERDLRQLAELAPGFRPSDIQLPDPRQLIEAYADRLGQRLVQLGAEIRNPDQVRVADLLDRALEGRRPFNEDGKKGFRDTLIWEHVLQVAAETDGRVVLITKNTKDFGSDGRLHEHLGEDLVRRGIARERIQLVVGIDEFNRQKADEFLPRLVEDEFKLKGGSHATLSLSRMLQEYEGTILDELEGNLDQLTEGCGSDRDVVQPGISDVRHLFRGHDQVHSTHCARPG